MRVNLVTLAVVLSIVFAVLKIENVIDWSWWLVLSPMLILLGFLVVVFILVFSVAVATELKK